MYVMLGRGRAIVPTASLDGPAHPPAAPEPLASASAGLLGTGQYNRGDATQGLVAGRGADVMNCSRLVGCKVGPCGAALASHASETHK